MRRRFVSFYRINRAIYRLGRPAAGWDAAKLTWRVRHEFPDQPTQPEETE